MEHLFFYSPNTGTIEFVDKEAILVDVPAELLDSVDDPNALFRDAADNPALAVIPLLETLEHFENEGVDERKVASGMDPQLPITLTGHEPYYVAAMIRRGIAATRELLQDQAKLAAESGDRDDVPKWALESLEGAHAYTKQMLAEAEQFIPKGLQ